MRYFKLEESIRKKVIGNAYPQIQHFKKGDDGNKTNSCSQLGGLYMNKIPPTDIDFNCLKIEKAALLTDYLSASYLNNFAGILISERLYEFVTQFDFPKHVTFSAGIYNEEEQLLPNSYKWVHYVQIYPELIDFEKSKFLVEHPEKNYYVEFKSYEDFIETKQQKAANYCISVEELVLKPNTSSLELFRLGFIDYNLYVREDIVKQMKKIGFTGMQYELAENVW